MRRTRADSIPENSTAMANASMEELLMRHSSPILHSSTGRAVASPLAERNSSPSPLRLNRPRSNPRTRTPMRAEEDQDEQEGPRRITIRPMAGAAVGTDMASSYTARHNRLDQLRVKSRKQGPSHRKARRRNNDNFVNLADELSKNHAGSAAAVEALLHGSANASKHRSIYDPKEHESKTMKQFREDKSLDLVREKFFDGSLPCDPYSSSSSRIVVVDIPSLTPLERFHRIESRIRRIVVKACENSYAASKVVNTLEDFLIRIYNGEKDERSQEDWNEFLLGSPIVTERRCSMKNKDQDEDSTCNPRRLIIKFLFDAESATGGFHRLLLHGICQFYCLSATSSSTRINMPTKKDGNVAKKARVLTATGTLSGVDVRLVEFITERQRSRSAGNSETSDQIQLDLTTNKLSELKV